MCVMSNVAFKTNIFSLSFSTNMSLSKIHKLVAEWYGLDEMPIRVLTKEAEICRWEMEHPEVPAVVWEVVDHDVRLVRLWGRTDICVDLVVFDEETQQLRMVQDICFQDAYPDAEDWRKAVLDLLRRSKQVWVVDHAS